MLQYNPILNYISTNGYKKSISTSASFMQTAFLSVFGVTETISIMYLFLLNVIVMVSPYVRHI